MSQADTGHYPIDLQSLPQSWVSVFTGEIALDIQPGFACGTHNREGIGVPHLRPMNVDREGSLDRTVLKYVPLGNDLRIRRGDVLFNNTNSPELIGKTTHIDVDGEFAFSNHMTRVRTTEGISPRFIAFQLHYLWMAGYFRHLCVKHVNQASVSSEMLAKRVPVVVPPEREQLRIVEEIEKQFSRLEMAVAALQRLHANLKRYRAAVLKAAVEGRLVSTEAEVARREGRFYETATELLHRIVAERRARWEADQLAKSRTSGKFPKDDKWKQKYREPEEPDTTNLPNLPDGWTWASLEQISWAAGYGTSQKCDYECSGPPVLRIPNIIRGKVELDDLKFAKEAVDLTESDALAPGDMLIVRTNGSRDLIGRTAVVDQHFPRPHFFASYLIRYRLVAAEGLAKWVSTTWDEFSNRRRIEDLAATTAGQYNVSVGNLNGLPIPLPPQAEMQRIVAEVERRLSVIDELEMEVEANLRRAGRLRHAILKRAFEGKLVPQDPNDEPATVLLERIRTERKNAVVPSRRITARKEVSHA